MAKLANQTLSFVKILFPSFLQSRRHSPPVTQSIHDSSLHSSHQARDSPLQHCEICDSQVVAPRRPAP
jgi:hypothetical protein